MTADGKFSDSVLARDVATLAAGIETVANFVCNAAKVDAVTRGKIVGLLEALNTNATKVAAATDAAGARPYVRAGLDAVNAVLQQTAGRLGRIVGFSSPSCPGLSGPPVAAEALE